MTQAANLGALGTNAGTTGILASTGGGTGTTAGVTGFKNRIINGAMSIWQRGTSSSSIGYQTVDRWSFYADSSRTVSRSTDVPTGFQYSTSLSGTGSTGLTQKIESTNCYGMAGNSITISFYLKQTTGAGSNAIGLNLYYANAADDWNASTQISTTQNFTTTSGWAQYSATFSNMPANSVNGLQVTIVTNSGSAVVFLLTGVQLEVGSTATSFDYRPYGTELQLCQRYYMQYGGTSTNEHLPMVAQVQGTTGANTSLQLPVQMRTTPSITQASTWQANIYGGSSQNISSFAISDSTPLVARLDITLAGSLGSAGQCARMLSTSTAARLNFSAEL